MGGLGMYSRTLGSLDTRHSHLCLRTPEMSGSLLSKGMASTGLSLTGFFTLDSVGSLGRALTLSKATEMECLLYPL